MSDLTNVMSEAAEKRAKEIHDLRHIADWKWDRIADAYGISRTRAHQIGTKYAEELKARKAEHCTHPGCASHVSHPCEGCGRQWN